MARAKSEPIAPGECVLHFVGGCGCIHAVTRKTKGRVYFRASCREGLSEQAWVSRASYEAGTLRPAGYTGEFYRLGSEAHERIVREQRAKRTWFDHIMDNAFAAFSEGASQRRPNVFEAVFGSVRDAVMQQPVDPQLARAVQVLQLPWPCTAAQLRACWRKAAFATHPDRGGSAAAFAAARDSYERCARALGVKP